MPIAGLLGVEFCAQPLRPGVWAKFGTFRVGDVLSTDHAVSEDTWCVKHGTEKLATDEVFRWERDHVVQNTYAAVLKTPFDIAGIDFGRADHATVAGREVIYEINTNPYLAPISPQRGRVAGTRGVDAVVPPALEGSGDADRHWAPQLQHTVEDMDGDLHFDRSAVVRARA